MTLTAAGRIAAAHDVAATYRGPNIISAASHHLHLSDHLQSVTKYLRLFHGEEYADNLSITMEGVRVQFFVTDVRAAFCAFLFLPYGFIVLYCVCAWQNKSNKQTNNLFWMCCFLFFIFYFFIILLYFVYD